MKRILLRTLVIWLAPALLALGCSASTPKEAAAPSDEATRGAEEGNETMPPPDIEKPATQPTPTDELMPEDSKAEEGKDEDKDEDSTATPKKKGKSKSTATEEKELDDEAGGEESDDSEDGDNAYIDPALP